VVVGTALSVVGIVCEVSVRSTIGGVILNLLVGSFTDLQTYECLHYVCTGVDVVRTVLENPHQILSMTT